MAATGSGSGSVSGTGAVDRDRGRGRYSVRWQHQARRFRALQRFSPTKPFPQFANAAAADRQNPIDWRVQLELPTAILGWANLTDFSQIDSPAAVDLKESVILKMRQKH